MAEWDGLPWHERQLLIDGLIDEFAEPDGEESFDMSGGGMVIEQAN